jgi:hypothetical protein
VPTGGQDQDVLTNGFAQLLERVEEDFLVESILHGVPTSTKLILGKPQFTLQDLKTLPRLSNSELTEQGIYIDVVENGDNVNDWRLYVGSASGQFGVAQRWCTYLEARTDGTHHSKEIKKPGRTINLRCIAHFGFSPDFWLNTFAESVFMLYLDTIYDPRITWNSPDYSSLFINDALYREVSAIRSGCALPIVEGRGLNRTWPLIQGWKSVGVQPGAKCVNCLRVVPEPNDPTFQRRHWRYADPSRPSASNIICNPCQRYQRRHGKARPSGLEEKRDMHVATARGNPGRCEHGECPRTTGVVWCGVKGHYKYYCTTHYGRADRGLDMDLAPVTEKISTRSRTTRKNPGKCEHTNCGSTHRVKLCGREGHNKFYCAAHEARARLGKDMDAPIQVQRRRSQE